MTGSWSGESWGQVDYLSLYSPEMLEKRERKYEARHMDVHERSPAGVAPGLTSHHQLSRGNPDLDLFRGAVVIPLWAEIAGEQESCAAYSGCEVTR